MDNEAIAKIFEDDKAITKCVTIRKDQNDFIKSEKKFMLSRFIQIKLDDWIKFRKGCKEVKGGNDDDREKTID